MLPSLLVAAMAKMIVDWLLTVGCSAGVRRRPVSSLPRIPAMLCHNGTAFSGPKLHALTIELLLFATMVLAAGQDRCGLAPHMEPTPCEVFCWPVSVTQIQRNSVVTVGTYKAALVSLEPAIRVGNRRRARRHGATPSLWSRWKWHRRCLWRGWASTSGCWATCARTGGRWSYRLRRDAGRHPAQPVRAPDHQGMRSTAAWLKGEASALFIAGGIILGIALVRGDRRLSRSATSASG
jgi:hypothetical protein